LNLFLLPFTAQPSTSRRGIFICIPIFAFWSVVTYRLLAEQQKAEELSNPKPPPMLTLTLAAC